MTRTGPGAGDIYDAVVIGAGMGGLSAAAFLAGEGMKVLVLEKHDKPGGLVTSFYRGGLRFDCGLEGLGELGKNDTIGQFLRYWGETLPVVKRKENIRMFIGGEEYAFRGDALREDFLKNFPGEKDAIERFFSINGRILSEMHSGGAPRPPYEMSFAEKLAFGAKAALQQPALLRYGLRNSTSVLNRIFKDKRAANAVFAKAMYEMVYLGYAYRWETVRRDGLYYPVGGMQAIPDRAAAAIRKQGGEVRLNAEAVRIRIEGGRAAGVRCADGTEYRARMVISNASPQFTADSLCAGCAELGPLRKAMRGRKPFTSCMLNFVGVRAEYDFKGANYIVLTDAGVMDTGEENYTPENCPIVLIVGEKPETQADHSVVIMAPVPYAYENGWRTEGGGRGEAYRALKARAFDTILGRVCEKLGEDFRKAVLFAEPSTPVTIERYTNSHGGSFMGWSIEAGSYGKFLPQATPVKDLYLVGQWVFPGFGVSGVMAGGYFLAKKILAGEGVDLEERVKRNV
jgi:phytoene dehydrogenase-like protein